MEKYQERVLIAQLKAIALIVDKTPFVIDHLTEKLAVEDLEVLKRVIKLLEE